MNALETIIHNCYTSWCAYTEAMVKYHELSLLSPEAINQEAAYKAYLEAHEAFLKHSEPSVELHNFCTWDDTIEVKYGDVIGFAGQMTGVAYLWAVNKHDEPNPLIQMDLDGTYRLRVGGLPTTTRVFTPTQTYFVMDGVLQPVTVF